NILVDEDQNCRLADFGLSKEASGIITTMLEPTTGGVKGSIRWMAPEMLGTSGTTDPNEDRSPRDIYAYACTVVEIMTGKPPFADFLDVAVITQVLLSNARPQRPTGVWCPDPIWELVEKCWHQNHLQRPTAIYIHNHLKAL
ncbi:kinase-like protein, partial [Marasmius fiardii PR-910]